MQKQEARDLRRLWQRQSMQQKNQLTPILNPGDTTISPTLYAKMGGAEVTETADSKKMYDGDETTYVSWQVKQQAGDYYGLDLGRVTTVTDVSILQAQKDGHHDISMMQNYNIQKTEKHGKRLMQKWMETVLRQMDQCESEICEILSEDSRI